jgi:hypothetical protein
LASVKVTYDNTSSGMLADNLQEAVDETVNSIGSLQAEKENLANKKSTLAENSEIYYPNQKAVNDGLDTKTSKSQIAYDNDSTTFIANTLASGAIIERGSNANGEYVKFADGTMVVHSVLTGSTDINYAWGSLYTSNVLNIAITFPSSFTSTPSVYLTAMGYSSNVWLMSYGNVTTSGIYTLPELVRATSTSNTQYRVFSMAIGRWK